MSLALFLAIAASLADPSDAPGPLLTVAEKSDFRATARHEDVVALLRALDARSDHLTLESLGTSVEGRDLPLAIIADPPVRSVAEARASGKTIFFAFGNIHAGEVCGKEALLMLARDLVTAPRRDDVRAILDGLIVVLAPIYNADGNERFDVDNRPGQHGPDEGMGQRPNAQGLDLNRDHMKLESPEAQALARFLTEWDPDVVVDTHTTNGSIHRFVLTFAAPQNPSAHPAPLEWTRDVMLPAVRRDLRRRTGYDTFFYGNLDREQTRWTTYSSQPRFGCPYRGLRNHLSILSEAYAYASYEDRVKATLEFVRECALYTARHRRQIESLRARANHETILAGRRADGTERVGLRHAVAPFPGQVEIPSEIATRDRSGTWTRSGVGVTWLVTHYGRFEPTVHTTRPRAYLIPPGLTTIVEKLRQHGVVVKAIEREERRPVEVDVVDAIERSPREFQGHHEVKLQVTRTREPRVVGPGWHRVELGQPLGTLALYLLESRSDDGLVTWNYLDAWLAEGEEYPILRDPGSE